MIELINENRFTLVYSFEPTKMDNDVLKALHDVEIDKNNYPNVYCWYNALMKYSLEERSRYVNIYFPTYYVE